MELHQAEALATVEEGQPDYTTKVLHSTGYGELADQWVSAAAEFDSVARDTPEQDMHERAVRSNVVRAYAKRCVTWARITQLRDQALGRIESIRHST